ASCALVARPSVPSSPSSFFFFLLLLLLARARLSACPPAARLLASSAAGASRAPLCSSSPNCISTKSSITVSAHTRKKLKREHILHTLGPDFMLALLLFLHCRRSPFLRATRVSSISMPRH